MSRTRVKHSSFGILSLELTIFGRCIGHYTNISTVIAYGLLLPRDVLVNSAQQQLIQEPVNSERCTYGMQYAIDSLGVYSVWDAAYRSLYGQRVTVGPASPKH